MKNETPTLNIKEITLLKTNPLGFYKKQLEKEETIDETERTVKHPVTERARYIGETGKKSEMYYDDDDEKYYYDILYKDGTKLTYEVDEYKRRHVGTESRHIYIPTDEDLEGSAGMAEPFAITDALEDRIFRMYPELEDEWEIEDEPEFDGEGWDVPISVDVYEETGGEERLKSVTTPDGETIDYIEDKGGQGWREDLTIPLTPDLKDRLEYSENGGEPFAITDALEWRMTEYYPDYIDNVVNEIKEVTDDSITFEAEFTIEGIDKFDKGSVLENMSDTDKSIYYNITRTLRSNDGNFDIVREKYSEEEIQEFNDIVSKNNYSGHNSFFTIQNIPNLPNGEGVNKAIVQNKDYNSEHVSTDINEVMKEKGKGWTIITLRENGNPANNGTGDGSGKFITAPGQKNERYLIDEERKIIFQRPYQPGMDRHIWG